MDVEVEITDHWELVDGTHPRFKIVQKWLHKYIGPYRKLDPTTDELPKSYDTGYSYRWIGTTSIDCYYIVFYRASDAVLFKMTWL